MRPLLLLACSGPKLEGTHRAIDLYQGVMFDVLRKWMPSEDAADVYIISALHGLIPGGALIAAYEQPMNPQRERALIAQGLDLQEFRAKRYNEVFIAGGAAYRTVGQKYVEQLRHAGFIYPAALVRSTSGGIGQQRGQLGAYLRSLGGAA